MTFIRDLINWKNNPYAEVSSKKMSAVIKDLSKGTTDKLEAFVFAEVLYRLFMEQSDSLNFIFSPAGEIILINPAVTRALGYEIRDLRRRLFMSFIHPDDLEETLEVFNNFRQGINYEPGFTNRYRKKDGLYIPLEWQASKPNPGSFFFGTAKIR